MNCRHSNLWFPFVFIRIVVYFTLLHITLRLTRPSPINNFMDVFFSFIVCLEVPVRCSTSVLSGQMYMPYKTWLCLSNYNNKGANTNNRRMEYGWRQNKDYVGRATCWYSKWVYKLFDDYWMFFIIFDHANTCTSMHSLFEIHKSSFTQNNPIYILFWSSQAFQQ